MSVRKLQKIKTMNSRYTRDIVMMFFVLMFRYRKVAIEMHDTFLPVNGYKRLSLFSIAETTAAN